MKKIDWNPSKVIDQLNTFGSGLYDQDREPAKARANVYLSNRLVFEQGGYITPEGRVIFLPRCQTHVYNKPISVEKSNPGSSPTLFSVSNCDILNMAEAMLNRNLHPVILCAANAEKPGGRYEEGSRTQEADLCRITTLSLSLNSVFEESHGGSCLKTVSKKQEIGYPMDENYGGIYSRVIVFRDGAEKGYAFREEPFEVSIISVAPLNFLRYSINGPSQRQYQADTIGNYTPAGKTIMKDKARTILRIALSEGHDSLILGNWGERDYGQNPEIITKLFLDVLNESEFIDKFKEVNFAIPTLETFNSIKRVIYSTQWTPPTLPIRNCFQIANDRIWGCEYPWDIDPQSGINKLRQALEFGITHFIDLTEEEELIPYSQFLPSQVKYIRFPIKDISCPKSLSDTYQLMFQIDEILKDTRSRIYLHCWGGVGRTGTIAACWIAFKRQVDYKNTMTELIKEWQHCPKSEFRTIPDSPIQCDFIKKFIDGLIKD